MKTNRSLFRFLPPFLVLNMALAPGGRGEQPAAEKSDTIAVVMQDCKASRPGKITGDTSTLSLLFAGPPKDKLVKRGTLQSDGQNYSIYLPQAKSYSTKNSNTGDNDFENTATSISVDQDGDGKLASDESWFANLPIRIGDKMFDMTEIAADGSRIELKHSKSPLSGVIVNRTCPAFSFKTSDGKEYSRDRLAGKPFILDIWSVT